MHQHKEATQNNIRTEFIGHTVYLNRYYNTDDPQVEAYYHAKSNHFTLASHVHFYKNSKIHIGDLGMRANLHYKFGDDNKKLVMYIPGHKGTMKWYKHNNAYVKKGDTEHMNGKYTTVKMAIVPKEK